MKCLVVSFEKEPKCSIQRNLKTTRSLNHKKNYFPSGYKASKQVLVFWIRKNRLLRKF